MKKVIISLFLTLSIGSALAQFEHPDLVSGKKHVQNVVLFPVVAEITKVGMKGPEPMIEESRAVEKELAPVIADALSKKGLIIDNQTLTVDALARDVELKYIVDDLQKQYDQQMGMMMKKSKDVRKGRFTLGDSVMKLPVGEKIDALLFVRAEGQVLTGGKKAFSWILTAPETDTVQITLGLADAKTGEVLYFAKPMMAKNMAKNPQGVHSGIEKSFKNFAKANANPVAAIEAPRVSSSPAPEPPAGTKSVVPAKNDIAESKSAPIPNPSPTESTISTAAPTAAPEPTSVTTASTPRVYVVVQRTERHIKYSDDQVFNSAAKQIGEYLKNKEVAYTSEIEGVIAQSEFEISVSQLLSAARSSKAQSILLISVDRPVTKWIEFNVQCFDMAGKQLWNEKTGSGGGLSGSHGLKVGMEHLRAALDPHVGHDGMPLLENAVQTSVGN